MTNPRPEKLSSLPSKVGSNQTCLQNSRGPWNMIVLITVFSDLSANISKHLLPEQASAFLNQKKKVPLSNFHSFRQHDTQAEISH